MYGQVKAAFGVFLVQGLGACWGFGIAVLHFGPDRIAAKRDPVTGDLLVLAQETHSVSALHNDHPVGRAARDVRRRKPRMARKSDQNCQHHAGKQKLRRLHFVPPNLAFLSYT